MNEQERRRRRKAARLKHHTINVVDGVAQADEETRQNLAKHGLKPDSIFFGETMTCAICGATETLRKPIDWSRML